MNAGGTLVDRHVGDMVRTLRSIRKISEREFAQALNISLSELLAAERGALRFGSALLVEASYIMNVPITAFFSGCPARRADDHDDGADYADQIIQPTIALRAMKALWRIDDPQLIELVLRDLDDIAASFLASRRPADR